MKNPDFAGATAEREVWVASLVAADCKNENIFVCRKQISQRKG